MAFIKASHASISSATLFADNFKTSKCFKVCVTCANRVMKAFPKFVPTAENSLSIGRFAIEDAKSLPNPIALSLHPLTCNAINRLALALAIGLEDKRNSLSNDTQFKTSVCNRTTEHAQRLSSSLSCTSRIARSISSQTSSSFAYLDMSARIFTIIFVFPLPTVFSSFASFTRLRPPPPPALLLFLLPSVNPKLSSPFVSISRIFAIPVAISPTRRFAFRSLSSSSSSSSATSPISIVPSCLSRLNFNELLELDRILPPDIVRTPSTDSTCTIVAPFTERADNTSPCIISSTLL